MKKIFLTLFFLFIVFYLKAQFRDHVVIDATFLTYMAKSVKAFDIDNDGDLDIISLSFKNNGYTIAWHENIDGQGNFGKPNFIVQGCSSHFYFGDIDGDSDIDFITYIPSQYQLIWFENVDGLGSFETEHIVDFDVNHNTIFHLADIDGDDDIDIITGKGSDINWHENIDGIGNFNSTANTIATLASQEVVEISVTDIDGDGDMDVLSAANSVYLFTNLDGLGTFSDQIYIHFADTQTSVHGADIDNDGDMDVVINSGWFENIDGLGDFDSSNLNSFIFPSKNSKDGTYGSLAVDLDGDTDLDVLLFRQEKNEISWNENDGIGNFTLKPIITSKANGVHSICVGDIDGDGDFDVLSASTDDSKISWYENKDGQGEFGVQNYITYSARYVRKICSIDIDGDGDIDIISTSNDRLAWYKNIDGKGSFSNQIIIDELSTAYIAAADIDGDNDMDIVTFGYTSGFSKILWYENTDGLGSFSKKRIIDIDSFMLHSNDGLFIYDIDADNDMDILVSYANQNGEDCHIFSIENTDGLGGSGQNHTLLKEKVTI